jgi:inorganic pyrophosphatase
LVAGLLGLLFALFLFVRVRSVSTQLESGFGDAGERKNEHTVELIDKGGHPKKTTTEINKTLNDVYDAVRAGADAFLMAEYRICLIFIAVFEVIVIVLVAHVGTSDPNANANGFDWSRGGYSGLSFGVGALCSIFTGYLSMKVAVFSNVRTAVSASQEGAAGWRGAFSTAMNAGGVTGFLLCSTAMLVLFFMCTMYSYRYGIDSLANCKSLFESIAGFGLGGSSIAMFGRVGGGIFTKAADVGSDLAGKVVAGIPEDDPRNPGVIADNVGDNVGDVAGMGSDLFGSFAEASCAALIVGSTSKDIVAKGWDALMFPIALSATGIFCGIVTHFFATDIWPVKSEGDVLRALKVQLGVSTLLVTASLWPVISFFLPETFDVDGDAQRHNCSCVLFHCCWPLGRLFDWLCHRVFHFLRLPPNSRSC